VLHAKASKDVPLVEMVFFEALPAQPTPLIVAPRAGDMITASLLALSPRFALRTVREVVAVLSVVEKVLLGFLVELFAAFAFVPGHATLEAHFKVTGFADGRPTTLIRL